MNKKEITVCSGELHAGSISASVAVSVSSIPKSQRLPGMLLCRDQNLSNNSVWQPSPSVHAKQAHRSSHAGPAYHRLMAHVLKQLHGTSH